MPSKCIVMGCPNRRIGEFRFFKIPCGNQQNTTKFINPLKEQRRQAWIKAINQPDLDLEKVNKAQICAKHFITGGPAPIEELQHPDWTPNVNMGYPTEDLTEKLFEYEAMKEKERVEKMNKEFEQRQRERYKKAAAPVIVTINSSELYPLNNSEIQIIQQSELKTLSNAEINEGCEKVQSYMKKRRKFEQQTNQIVDPVDELTPTSDGVLKFYLNRTHEKDSSWLLEMDKRLKFICSNSDRDECAIYGNYVANKLRKLDCRTRYIVKHTINKILFDADTGKYASTPSSKPNKVTTSQNIQVQDITGSNNNLCIS